MMEEQIKKFSDLTQDEIDSMTDEEYNTVPPEEKRSCHDCAHLKPAIRYWCSNKEAIELRGTSIPGCIRCPSWELMKPVNDIINILSKKLEALK